MELRNGIGATQLNNITDGVQNVIDNLPNYTTKEDCCNYPYQILDGFCASQVI